jgi:hypothetical protein
MRPSTFAERHRLYLLARLLIQRRWSTTVGQFIAKTAGALLWSLLIARVRVRQGTGAAT